MNEIEELWDKFKTFRTDLNSILHRLLNLTGDDSTLSNPLHDEIDAAVPAASESSGEVSGA